MVVFSGAGEKEKIEVKNVADNLCYQAEKTLKDAGDKVSEDDKKKVEEMVKELRGMLETAEADDIKKKSEELGQELQKIGQAMYEAASKQEAANGEAKESENKGNGKAEDEGEVKEGEVVEE